MDYLNTCYTIHTSYIITHMRKALFIFTGLCDSNVTFRIAHMFNKNGLIELICMCDSNVHYYNLEHFILYEFNN